LGVNSFGAPKNAQAGAFRRTRDFSPHAVVADGFLYSLLLVLIHWLIDQNLNDLND